MNRKIKMNKKIAVVGTGAIGSSVGADLTDAGYDVTIVDQWPQHVEAMKSSGLHIEMTDLDLKIPVTAYHLCEMASVKPAFDIVFLTSKSYDTRWLAEFIKPYLKEDGTLVSLQNSMNDDDHASIIGKERTVGCVIELSAEIFTPGKVQRNTTRSGTWFAVGELDGQITERAKELQKILSNVAVTDITENIYGARWTKLTVNSMTMGPFGVLGLRAAEALQLPGMLDLNVEIGKECLEIGTQAGYQIEPVFGLSEDDFAGPIDQVLKTAMKTLQNHTGPKSRTAPIQDHIKNRKNELEYINGLVSKKAKELGIPSPYNDAVAEIARRINRGELEMDASHYELILDLAKKAQK
tara:strand:- start:947 stop:2002 length:1056 start_codon:yes stop_codon:yes gene_type:complete